MFKIKEFFELHEKFPDKAHEVAELFEEFLLEVKIEMPEVHKELMEDIDEVVDIVTEEEIACAISNMERKDGVKEPKWKKEEVIDMIKSFSIHEKAGKDFCNHQFWFAMNYAYATHAAPNKTISVYIDLALDEMFDKNVTIKEKIRILNED